MIIYNRHVNLFFVCNDQLHNACLHIDYLFFDDAIILLTVFETLYSVFEGIARLRF